MPISRFRRATAVLLAATAVVGAFLVWLPRTGRITPLVPREFPATSLPHVAVIFHRSCDRDRFGIACPQLDAPPNHGAHKRLFFEYDGTGNRTVIDLNGYHFIFGDTRYLGQASYQKNQITGEKLRQTPISGKNAWISTMTYTDREATTIEVTRTIEIVASDSTQRLDTVRVKYHVKNTGQRTCVIGLQTHLDTWIGTTNEVPFYVPPIGGRPGRLVDAKTVFFGAEVPDFVVARELDDLDDPNNTHTVLGVRLQGLEAPSKVVLCPANRNVKAPMAPANEAGVEIEWQMANLLPEESRTFGYDYGLGRLEFEAPLAGQQIALQFIRAPSLNHSPSSRTSVGAPTTRR